MFKNLAKIFTNELNILFIIFVLFFIMIDCGKKPTAPVPINQPPEIIKIIYPETVGVGETCSITLIVNDPEDDSMFYFISSPNGSFQTTNMENTVQWTAPNYVGVFAINCYLTDGNNSVEEIIYIQVI